MMSTDAPKFGCPACGCQDSRVVDSRPLTEHEGIRRRRQCCTCGHRYTTQEQIVITPQMRRATMKINLRDH